MARAVYSIERLRGLHERAHANLHALGLAHVTLIWGDGSAGWASGAPYSGIIAAAAGTEIPEVWCEQLAPGARLVAPVVVEGGKQALVVVEKSTHGLTRSVVQEAYFVPLKPGME